LGTIVSAAYLVPAFANAKYFPVSQLDIPIDNGPNGDLLVFGWNLLTGHSGKSRFVQFVSLATVDTVLFLAFCSLWRWRKARGAAEAKRCFGSRCARFHFS
jgi:hypothetical protein